METTTIRLIFQSLTVVFITAVMVVEILNFKLCDKNIGYRFAIFFLMLHELLFYTVVFYSTAGFSYPGTVVMTNWSSGLRLHEVATILFLEASRYYLNKLLGKGGED